MNSILTVMKRAAQATTLVAVLALTISYAAPTAHAGGVVTEGFGGTAVAASPAPATAAAATGDATPQPVTGSGMKVRQAQLAIALILTAAVAPSAPPPPTGMTSQAMSQDAGCSVAHGGDGGGTLGLLGALALGLFVVRRVPRRRGR